MDFTGFSNAESVKVTPAVFTIKCFYYVLIFNENVRTTNAAILQSPQILHVSLRN